MIKRLLITLVFIYSQFFAYGQDPHFSQYFASPLSINPANTGFLDGTYRVSANYRQQWRNVGEAYNTSSISADMNFYATNTSQNDKMGAGVMVLNEESLGGILKSNYFSISGSYHKNLAEDNSRMLGLGVQAGIYNKRLDYNKLTFASQYNGSGFDPSINPQLSINQANVTNVDINAGILYFSSHSWGSWYAGISAYHLAKPTESLFSANGNVLPIRSTIHTGGVIGLNENLNCLFSGFYMRQNNFEDRMLGGAVEFLTNGTSKFQAGIWYRFGDALIPYVGIDLNGLAFGFNYGINATAISNYRPRTVEFSIIFRKPSPNKLALCPQF